MPEEIFSDKKRHWLRFTQWPRPSITADERGTLQKRLVNIVRSAYLNVTPMIEARSDVLLTRWEILTGNLVTEPSDCHSENEQLIRRGRFASIPVSFLLEKSASQKKHEQYLRQRDVFEPHPFMAPLSISCPTIDWKRLESFTNSRCNT
jgi:hypothetical protein